MRFRSPLLLASLLLVLSSSARAEDEAPPPRPAPRCAVDRHVGFSDEEAAGVEQVVCLAALGTPGDAIYRLTMGRLGSSVVLTLAALAPDGVARPPHQIVVGSLEEVPVAARRLLEARAEDKPVAETADATNIVGPEARAPKKKAGEVHVWLGAVGVALLGGKGSTGAGANLAMVVGAARTAFLSDLRIVGGDATHVALTGGVRHQFSASDTAAFVGGGLGVTHLADERRDDSGLAFYAEIGVEALRTSQFGGGFVVRIDMPTFSLPSSGVVPVLSAGIGTRF